MAKLTKLAPIKVQVEMDDDAEKFIRRVVREELDAREKEARIKFRENLERTMRELATRAEETQ